MTEVLLVGIGNPFRGDDGIGYALLDLLEALPADRKKISSDMTELLSLFQTYKTVILIDACQGPFDTWKRFDCLSTPLPKDQRTTSTHGISVSQVILLAKELNLVPEKLILYAINGTNFKIGSSPKTTHLQEVAEEIKKEVLAYARERID